jgi:hypothetical protein
MQLRHTRGVAYLQALSLPILLALLGPALGADLPKCLFVSSYHQGYAWSDGVERGLRQTLDGKCRLRQFDMDTKRKKSPADKAAAALQAKALIESWQPDVVITADDNAAKYLVQPHYKEHPLPFVFCGVNWTAKEYGFPYTNVTGMIEVAPVQAMVDEARALVPGASRVLYIGADTATERKNAARLRKAAEQRGLVFEQRLAPSLATWIDAYRQGQTFDFIIIGSNSGISDWDEQRAMAAIHPMTQRLTVTSHDWMMPVSMLGMTKIPEEQGEWAGQVALQILGGAAPNSIPVIANRKWDLFLNHSLIRAAGVELPAQLSSKGKVYN